MGCAKSKKKEEEDLNAPLPGNPNAMKQVDEKINLTHRQVFSLKQSWRGIARKIDETGIDMFLRLFRSNPEVQQQFRKIKDIKSEEELRSNMHIERHAGNVMSVIEDALTHMDSYDYVQKLLSRISASHNKFEGFHPRYFLLMRKPFLDAVRETLGDRFTENMENIYTYCIDLILEMLVEQEGGMQPPLEGAELKDAASSKFSSQA